jgi:hypothetical protein
MKSVEIQAPIRTGIDHNYKKVFLAGSIEQGVAEQWQKTVVKSFPFNVNFLNPRRSDWDDTWEQNLNNPGFYEQVTWELDMLNESDIIFMYFDPATKSPVSLLELGMFSEVVARRHDKSMVVCCPEGFWRKGNVDIVCQYQGIPHFNNMETAIIELRRLLAN